MTLASRRLIERAPDGRLFNSYVICLRGGRRYCHRKLYAFEHRRIECGNQFTGFDTAWGMRIGILIGSDNYLIENVRMTALMGATLLVAPHRRYGVGHGSDCRIQSVSTKHGLREDSARRVASASADDDRGDAGWLRRWLPARAGDNGMFVAFSDGVDVCNEGECATDAAMILDPCGRILADSTSASGASAIISADLDSGLIDQSVGRKWLMGRRPGLYGPLTQSVDSTSAMSRTSRAMAGGSVALSFAVVGRDRLIRERDVR